MLTGKSRDFLWIAGGLLCAALLYWIAVSNTAYELTSPSLLLHHTILRKLYALGAFTLLGYLVEKSPFGRRRDILKAALVVGFFSIAIEIGQYLFSGARERWLIHAFDIASGIGGGAFGACLASLSSPRSSSV
jgi:hypothetical protein